MHVSWKQQDIDTTDKAYVVDQINPKDNEESGKKAGSFDEHKAILGAKSLEEAKAIYERNYSPGWKGLGAITEMPMDEFKDWLTNADKSQPVSQELQQELPADKERRQNSELRDYVEHKVKQEKRIQTLVNEVAGGKRTPEDADKTQDALRAELANAKAELAAEKEKNSSLEAELLVNPLSKIPNKRAFYDSNVPAFVASIDGDGVKFINDAMTHPIGDKLLVNVAEALHQQGGAFHVSGDEYIMKGDSYEELESRLKAAQQDLLSGKYAVKAEGGTYHKPTFSYGITTTKGLKPAEITDKSIPNTVNNGILVQAYTVADTIMKDAKDAKKAAGPNRGGIPESFELTPGYELYKDGNTYKIRKVEASEGIEIKQKTELKSQQANADDNGDI